MSTTPAKRTHTAVSAAILLMISAFVSGLLGLVRIRYINHLFPPGIEQDAYIAAFKWPDLLAYFLVGSAASVSMITMLNRYRDAGDEEGADRALSVVLTTMLAVLIAATIVFALAAPLYVYIALGKEFYHDARGPLCISLTRWLLPAQLFFFIGSMLSARLQVRKIFIYQALTPVIYNGGILLGAYLFHRKVGVYSPVIGVLAGVIVGSFLLNSLGALRTGFRFSPRIGFKDEAFLEWLQAALPLMIGVSLVMFDGLFFNRFAADNKGDLSLINIAKNLFNAPFSVIGPSVGAASLPFFASLFQRKQMWEFSTTVGRSVSRLFAVGMLIAAWMIPLGPWLMDLLRGGLSADQAARTTLLLRIFCLTLPLWAVQGLYARAFYATSDTRTPAIAGTTIVVLSFPFYWLFYRLLGINGLAVASDLGILLQTATLAILLHRKRLASIAHLDNLELGRALLAAVLSGLAASYLTHLLPSPAGYKTDFLTLTGASIGWAVVALAVLFAMGSSLPKQLLRRK